MCSESFHLLPVYVLLLAAPNPGYNRISILGTDTINRGKDHGYIFHYISWQPAFISVFITTRMKTAETLKLRYIFLLYDNLIITIQTNKCTSFYKK